MTDFAVLNKINRRLHQLQRDGVEFIAGTIAPADSDHETNDIESVAKAIEYYQNKNPDIVLTIQPKWMGSRAQMYLYRNDINKSFMTTRNGFVIRYGSDRLDNSVFEHWHNKIFDCHKFHNTDEVILDGELMPWSAIGKGLIEREFNGYINAIENEVQFLEQYGIANAVTDFDLGGIREGWLITPDNLKNKNPYHETNALFSEFMENVDFDSMKTNIGQFKTELNNYNIECDPYFVAFDILRLTLKDGSQIVDTGWMGITSEKYDILKSMLPEIAKEKLRTIESNMYKTSKIGKSFTIKNKDNTISQIEHIMDAITRSGMEGIMLKVEFPAFEDAVHCMKIRNKNYLRLIYGFDYDQEGLTELVQKKRTGKKRKLSHHEYKLGQEMLKLDKASPQYKENFERIAKAILFEIEEESTVDSRL